MPTFGDPVADAVEAREALRGLAYATRHAPDPIAAYRVLEALTWTTTALQTSLEQLASAYRGYAGTTTLVGGDSVAGAAEARKIAAHLQKAARQTKGVAAHVQAAWDLDGHTDYPSYPPAPGTARQLSTSPPPASPDDGPAKRPGPAGDEGLAR